MQSSRQREHPAVRKFSSQPAGSESSCSMKDSDERSGRTWFIGIETVTAVRDIQCIATQEHSKSKGQIVHIPLKDDRMFMSDGKVTTDSLKLFSTSVN
eukprot:766602-Hanusia_phi.AAC.5